MKIIYFALALILFTMSTLNSQSLNSISSNADIFKKSSNKESLLLNLKLDYYIHFSAVKNRTEKGYGFLSELQIMSSRKLAWIVTGNIVSLIKKDHDNLQYTKFGGIILTIGPKLYFNNSDLQVYTSLGVGGRIGGEYSAFTATPALGMEYKISDKLRVSFETKTNFYLNYWFATSLFFNAGIGIDL